MFDAVGKTKDLFLKPTDDCRFWANSCVTFERLVTLLSRLNRTQKTTLVLLVLIVVLRVVRMLTGHQSVAAGAVVFVLFIVLLPFAVLPPLARRFTWRVRNRLLLTDILVGILPIFLVVLFVQVGFFLVIGQVTNYLVHSELDRQLE
jgi:phosphoserine phosphatase RsbU/P